MPDASPVLDTSWNLMCNGFDASRWLAMLKRLFDVLFFRYRRTTGTASPYHLGYCCKNRSRFSCHVQPGESWQRASTIQDEEVPVNDHRCGS